MFSGFNGSQDVTDAGDPENGAEAPKRFLRDSISPGERFLAGGSAENLQAFFARDVVQTHDRVHVEHVVNPGHVLVADPLDIVSAIAVVIQRRALDGFKTDDSR